jgi:hypothetical protein
MFICSFTKAREGDHLIVELLVQHNETHYLLKSKWHVDSPIFPMAGSDWTIFKSSLKTDEWQSFRTVLFALLDGENLPLPFEVVVAPQNH